MSNITCFGGVLWDVFPTHKKIGGAPLNVAIRLQALGNQVHIISAIGDDKNGAALLEFINDHDVNTALVQVSPEYKTGKVKVMLNEKGSASYDIMFPRAWDRIIPTAEAIANVKNADAFIFGSLVARDDCSRQTLFQLIDTAKYKIFDVNLRQPYYSRDLLTELLNKADFVKFNDDELFEISGYLGSPFNALEQNILYVSEKTGTKNICITKGRHGAVLYLDGKFYYNSGYKIKVVDTVGAGDSFLASLISQLFDNIDPQTAIDFACAVGALVAQEEGANPEIEREAIENFIHPVTNALK